MYLSPLRRPTVWGSPGGAKEPIVKYGPKVWLPNGNQVSFWHGGVYQFGDKWLNADKADFYEAFSLTQETAFPLRFIVGPDILKHPIEITIPGFGYFKSANVVEYDA